MATEYVYVPFNSRPAKGKPYLAIGGVSYNASSARNFMGDADEWRRLSRQGWKILKCKIIAPGARRVSRSRPQ